MEQQIINSILQPEIQKDQDHTHPEMLYHYTGLEELAMILKNRTIRLHPLDKMDDLQEGKTADIPNLGKFIFISAWTSEKEESIPMWKIYTDTESGVRIGLKANPFIKCRITGEDLVGAGFYKKLEQDRPLEMDCFLNPIEMLSKGYVSRQAFADSILTEVQYTNDINLLEPKADVLSQGIEVGNFTPLGRYKNKYWEFQKEWRYLLEFVPMKTGTPLHMFLEYKETVRKMLRGTERAPFRHFDLQIDPEAFSEMEIVTSPHFTNGNQVILDTLVEKFNPDAKVVKSDLLNLI